MDNIFNTDQILGYIFILLIIYFCWNLNARTRKLIDKWANDNNLKILSRIYIPWHWYLPLCGGFHPANFKVIVENYKKDQITYWIAGGGLFLANDDIKIRKGRKKKLT